MEQPYQKEFKYTQNHRVLDQIKKNVNVITEDVLDKQWGRKSNVI